MFFFLVINLLNFSNLVYARFKNFGSLFILFFVLKYWYINNYYIKITDTKTFRLSVKLK